MTTPLDRLIEILDKTTTRYRKGPEIEERQVGRITVTEIYAMPHVDTVPANLEKIDVGVPMVIGVDKELAMGMKDELRQIILEITPEQEWKQGPSYITVGAWLGSQDAAFSLFAFGEVVGFWKVLTPRVFGFEDEDVIKEMAVKGYVMVSGLHDA